MNSHSSLRPAAPRRRWASLPILIVAALFILVPFWTWYGTWFGRKLSDAQITEYLSDNQKPRKIQHALLQLEQRVVAGDPAVKRWYPQIAGLANHPVPEIRGAAAWVMGQDNTSESFHQTLTQMLADAQPMVRRNAALALVRFGDDRGHQELLAMLRPYTVEAPGEGTVTVRLKEGDSVTAGALIARISPGRQDGRGGAEALDVRSPLPGRVSVIMAKGEAKVSPGEGLAVLSPDKGQVWEALRALYFVGRLDDLSEVERYGREVADMPDKVKQQAVNTAEAIRKRSSQ